MALFGNTEKAKQRSLSKILGYTRDDDKKTLDQLENEFQDKIGALPTDYNKQDLQRIKQETARDVNDTSANNNTLLNTQTQQTKDLVVDPKRDRLKIFNVNPDLQDTIPRREEVSRIQDVNTEALQNIDITSPLVNEVAVQSNNNQVNTLFNDLARENLELSPEERIRDLIISSIGEEPELDEARLKRAKTQALVNAFGNLLQAGVGLQQLQSGNYFQAQPRDNSQVLANLEGVYDDYYKELAQYRDNKSDAMLKLASLDAGELQDDRKAKQDELDRQNRLQIEDKRIQADKEKEEFRLKGQKEIQQLRIDAEKNIQNARNDNQRREFINDGMRNLNNQYANIFDRYQEINELLDQTLDESERSKLIEESNEIVKELNSINDEINIFRDYSKQLIETGEIVFDKTQEEETVKPDNTSNSTTTENATETTPQAGSLDEALRESRNEIGTILNDDLNFMKSNLGSIDLTNLDSLKQLKEKLVEIRKDSYSESVRNKYFNDPKADIDSINKLEARVTSLIEEYEKINTANEFGG